MQAISTAFRQRKTAGRMTRTVENTHKAKGQELGFLSFFI